jgi:thiol-disulfide isomerase/thioredoxin
MVAVLAGCAALGAVAIGAYYWTRSHSPAQANAEQSEVYELAMDDADGHRQSFSQWKGKVLVVNFWATWCAPCVAEMPALDHMQQELSAKNVSIIGIGIEDQAHVRQFRDRLGLHLPLLAGGYESLALARSFGDYQGVLPYTALLSADGRVIQSQTGALEPGQLQEWLKGTL